MAFSTSSGFDYNQKFTIPGISYKAPEFDTKGAYDSQIPWDVATKYKPSPDVFDKPKTGKDFLDAFTSGMQGMDKYQKQSQQGGYQTGGDKGASGGGVGQIGPDTFIYTPQAQYSPFTVTTPGRPGLGGAIGTGLGIAASFIPGLGPGIAAAMPAIGGTIGGAFG